MRPSTVIRSAAKFLKYSTFAVVTGTVVGTLYKNDWQMSSIGAVRFSRSVATAAVVVADYKISLRQLDPKSETYWHVKSQVHRRSAERLRDLCCRNGGAYIKVGQHIGALEYLLPREYVETMKILHSSAPQSSKEDIRRVVQEDLGKEVEEVFSSFDDHPIGAASLAQVHRATLKDGTMVAVKVQHPRVRAHSLVDMATMEFLVHIIARLFPEFQFIWLAEETRRNLPKELDFVHEAKNCERVGKMFAHWKQLKIPKVHWDLTTERVLTMEYCEGGQVNDREYMSRNGIDIEEVTRKLGQLYSEMIFVHGYIHCDPHPGNILVNKVRDELQLVLLDHGLYQTLTDDFRLNYCKFWRSILRSEVTAMKRYSERLGIGRLYPLLACMVTARSWDAITRGVDKQGVTKAEDNEIQSSVANYLPEISDILNSVPRQMLLIFKTNDLLRGIESTLETRGNTNSFIAMSKTCVRAIYAHKLRKCPSVFCRARQKLREQYYLCMLTLYQWFVWLKGTPLGQVIANCCQNTSPTDVSKLTLS